MKKAFLFILVLTAFCTLIGCGSTKQVTQLVRDIQRDSIPYEVTITEVKEITRPLTLFDKTCRACFWFLLGILGLYLYRVILEFRKL